MDNERFETLLKLAYRRATQEDYKEMLRYRGFKNYELFGIDEVREIFRYYFKTYQYCRDREHPNINIEQAARIISLMPYTTNSKTGEDVELFPSDYTLMIDQHFGTYYPKCDFNIVHFFSGDIRWYRHQEILRE